MTKEKLKKSYEVLLHYLQEGVYKPDCHATVGEPEEGCQEECEVLYSTGRSAVLRGRSASNVIAVILHIW